MRQWHGREKKASLFTPHPAPVCLCGSWKGYFSLVIHSHNLFSLAFDVGRDWEWRNNEMNGFSFLSLSIPFMTSCPQRSCKDSRWNEEGRSERNEEDSRGSDERVGIPVLQLPGLNDSK